MLESFNYRRALSWEKSPAVKRLIVFESPSEGRKWANGRDNWAADSWVDYGLLRLFQRGKEKEVNEGRRRGGRREGRGVCEKARVVRRSRRGRLASLRRRENSSPVFRARGDPWPPRMLLPAPGASPHCEQLDHCELIFHTLCKHWGETQYENAAPFHIFTPLLLFPHAILLSGVKDPSQPVRVGECCDNIGPLFFFSLSRPVKYFLAEKIDVSFLKKILGGGHLTWCNNHRSVNQRDVMYNYCSVW